jgi:hypothetical protein
MDDNINLFYPAILTNLITILLFINSKIHDRILLFFMIIGQIILISGDIFNNRKLIELSHVLFTLTIIIGTYYFNEKQNLYFIGTLLSILFITRYLYNDKCLFHLNSNNYRFNFIEEYFDWDWVNILKMIFIYLIYRLWNL